MNPRSTEFLLKAEKLLRWIRDGFWEMGNFADLANTEEVERVFWNLLAQLSSVHESLAAAAKTIGKADWRRSLEETRETDPLLRWLWKARNAETHDVVTKWEPDDRVIGFCTTDSAWTESILRRDTGESGDVWGRLTAYVYGVDRDAEVLELRAKGIKPRPELLERARVQLKHSVGALTLAEFSTKINGRSVDIAAPTMHLGSRVHPSADIAVETAMLFYEARLAELRSELDDDSSASSS